MSPKCGELWFIYYSHIWPLVDGLYMLIMIHLACWEWTSCENKIKAIVHIKRPASMYKYTEQVSTFFLNIVF